ncbi:MAG TPA: hypothetical protein VGM72_09020 [Micropepsaceae bacterium]|jgi:hypothetical protein
MRFMGILSIPILCALTGPASAELRDSYTPVTIVALGTIAEPDDYAVLSNGTPQPSFAQSMAGQDLHLGEELHSAIAAALLAKKLKVIPADGENAHYRLDVAIPLHTVAYSDSVTDSELMPGFVVLVMVRDMRTGEIRLRDRIVYGRTDIESGHVIDGDARYRFASEDALLAHPKMAAEGLRAGIAAVADEIAGIMAK